MTFIDFFAGVGGFRKGMENAGHKCVGFCEWDKYARASYVSMHLITEEQRAYLSTLDLKQRQKEILKDEYLNGEFCSTDVRLVTGDTVPRADCYCFGAPCQDFSVAGRREGLSGDRSSLVREIFRILGELEEADRPEWLIYENVKGMLSSNQGRDYLEILMAMDELGYDAEWFVFNSKYHGVPQNRERVYTIGHFRGRGPAKVFPLEGTDGENRVEGVSLIGTREGYRRNLQTFSPDGVTEALSTCSGGGREHHVAIKCVAEVQRKGRKRATDYLTVDPSGIAPTLRATDSALNNSSVIQPIIYDDYNGRMREDGLTCTLTPNTGSSTERNGQKVVLPVLTPDRTDSFGSSAAGIQIMGTLDPNGHSQMDVHGGVEHPGMFVRLPNGAVVYAVWYPKYECYVAIRKLTPRECFRLQGWEDKYFDRAEMVNSDSQLYKQAGNQVTVNVVEVIGRRLAEIERVRE